MARFAFQHLHLRSPDPEATAAFYATMFGAEVIRWEHQGASGIDLRLGGIDVYISAVSPGSNIAAAPRAPHEGLDHFGLAVHDLDAVVAELKAKGAEFTTEPRTVHPSVRIAFLRGPQDVCIELVDDRRDRED